MFANVSDENLEVIFFFSSLIFQINAAPSPDNKNSKILKKRKMTVKINTISLVIFPVTIFQVRNVRKQLS